MEGLRRGFWYGFVFGGLAVAGLLAWTRSATGETNGTRRLATVWRRAVGRNAGRRRPATRVGGRWRILRRGAAVPRRRLRRVPL
ncbi:MAG: hypothetical protein IRY95_09440 [Clostridia bacterium]|nr:hypothetical protein [Clostridia bacterium]